MRLSRSIHAALAAAVLTLPSMTMAAPPQAASELAPPPTRSDTQQRGPIELAAFLVGPGQLASSYGFSCSGKRTCKEMSSCEEARYYLEQCGLSRLDRDHDGVPCESLC